MQEQGPQRKEPVLFPDVHEKSAGSTVTAIYFFLATIVGAGALPGPSQRPRDAVASVVPAWLASRPTFSAGSSREARALVCLRSFGYPSFSRGGPAAPERSPGAGSAFGTVPTERSPALWSVDQQ